MAVDRAIPTPAKAKWAVDIMFDSMEDHYRELMAETNDFFENNVVKLPANSHLYVTVLSGIRFHCLHHKGKKFVVPEDMLEYAQRTSMKKVLRKRYALNVICFQDKSHIVDAFENPKVLEVLPCIAKGFKERRQVVTPFPPKFEYIKHPGIIKGLDLDKHPSSMQAVMNRTLFRIKRIQGAKGIGTYEIVNEHNTIKTAIKPPIQLLIEGTEKQCLTPKFDLKAIYCSEHWVEEMRKVLTSMREKGQL